MTQVMQLFDTLLALSLVVVAGAALLWRDLFRSVVLFIVFGLLLSLVWIRLDAVDIALAEAAIGAGLTGVLLLNITSFLRRQVRGPAAGAPKARPGRGDGHAA